MSVHGASNATLSQSLFALKYAYGFFQYVKSMQFYNPRKRYKLFANSVISTAATHWEKANQDLVEVTSFQETLDYGRSCLQEWVKAHFGTGSRCKHFAFMRAKGLLIKLRSSRLTSTHFRRQFFLYNKLGDFFWPDPADPILKSNENELKCCFY